MKNGPHSQQAIWSMETLKKGGAGSVKITTLDITMVVLIMLVTCSTSFNLATFCFNA